MKRKVYWKDLFASFTHSKGRFLSILTLMLLGSLALVGLKVTTPNMHRTANQFIQQQKMLDLAVMGDLGLDQADQEELLGVKGARVEFGSLLDLTVKGTGKAIRLFSAPKSLSSFRVTKGRLPKKEGELALASFWEDRYQIGDTLTLEEKAGTRSSLKRKQFTIVGFVQSSEMWSQKNLGTAMSGSGNLDAYALVSKEVFTTKLPAMARIQFDDLRVFRFFFASLPKTARSSSRRVRKTSERQWKGPLSKTQAGGGWADSKRPERTQSCQGNTPVSQESDRSGSKAIRLAGGPVQETSSISAS